MAYLHDFNNAGHSVDKMEMPFKVKLNFKKLFEYWEAKANGDIEHEAIHAQSVLKQLEKTPILRSSIGDMKIIEKHRKEVQLLLSPMFPELTSLNEIKAVTIPFNPIYFNLTGRFKNIMKKAGENAKVVMRIDDPDLIYIMGCTFILNVVFKIPLQYFRTLFFDIPDEVSRLMRHYLIFFNADFTDFIIPEGFVLPTPEEIKELKDNFEDIKLWKKYFPPNAFTYEGFSIATLFDITREEGMSGLKVNLLKKDALETPEILDSIRENIGSIFNIPDLELGFVLFDKNKNSIKALGRETSLVLGDISEKKVEESFCSYSGPQLFDRKTTLIISEIKPEFADRSALVARLVDAGVRSFLAAPLIYDNEVIGILELGAKNPCQLNSIVGNLVEEVTPLFTTAMKRVQDELENKLEAVIQEQCTAIHPSVSWKFFAGAEEFVKRQKTEDLDTMDDIQFPEVYPLYGQSDIKGSSTERNKAIQEDMIEQLTRARRILDLGIKNQPLVFYKELKFRINDYIKSIKKGLNAGDEITVLEFLKREIYPVFKHLNSLGGSLSKAVEGYRAELDPELGVIYKQRKGYEMSVSMLNNKMGHYLDKSQEQAQEMFPHYFEKYKTDGVEHDLYIGQSMVSDKVFNPVYLKNLRIWQLMVTCELENMVHRLKPTMPVPLGVASLILIHSNPINIKFRMEEKRFDVEGAYNIRYEIIKKRIDKAYIKGTTERLTQPGKIAIVYSQEKEAREYQHYLNYLQSINYIGPNIEWLDLNDMQGVTGLKALRVEVIYHEQEMVASEKAVAVLETGHIAEEG